MASYTLESFVANNYTIIIQLAVDTHLAGIAIIFLHIDYVAT